MNLRKLQIVWAYLIIFIMCMLTGGDWCAINSKFQLITNAVLLLLSVVPLIKMFCSIRYVKLNYFIIPSIVLIFLIINTYQISYFITFIIKFYCVLASIYYFKNKNIDYINVLMNLIYFLAITSLLFYLCIVVLKIDIPYQSYLMNGVEHRNYFFLFFSNQYINIGNIKIIRNNSIFWEPGMFQIYINIALFYELFFKNKFRINRVIIFIVTLMTTTSTTGIIVLIIIILLKIIHCNSENKFLNIIKIFPIITLLLTTVIYIVKIINYKKTTAIMSYSARSNDFFIGIKLFIMKPFNGWGFLNYDIYNKYANTTLGNSNGLVSLAFQMGLIGLIIYIFLSYKLYIFLIQKYKNKLYAIYFVLILIVMNLTEPITYLCINLLFLLSGLFLDERRGEVL